MASRAPSLEQPDREPVAASAGETPRRAPGAGCSDAAVGESCQEPIVSQTSGPAGESVAEVPWGTPLPIGARLGDYEVIGVVHQGESGVVYVAAYRSLLGKVAIKEYFPARLADRMANGSVGVRSLRHQRAFRDGKKRFLSEARLLAAFDEPALVKVLRSWEQYGTAYMAMPLYEGRTLRSVLRDSPRPSEAWLKAMVGPLLDALARLHRSDRCPCDVTPDNIVVLTNGAPLFVDSGAAPRNAASTTEGVTDVLNSGFAAIEQYAGDASLRAGPWTDVYAVAAVLHLAITGKPPPAPTKRIVADTLPAMSDVTGDYSRPFLDALDRGLAVHPKDRPQSIAEFRAALGIPRIASGAIPMRHPPPPSPVQRRLPSASSQPATGDRSGGRPATLVMSLIVVGLAGLGLIVWALGGPGQMARGTADRASTVELAPASAQPGALAATPAPAIETATLPLAPGATAPGRELAVERATPSSPSRPESATPAVAAASRTGKIDFSIKPWGQIMVDGKARGVSPPVKELSIPEGRHRIEIRNGTFPGYASEVNVKAGSRISIAHSFAAP